MNWLFNYVMRVELIKLELYLDFQKKKGIENLRSRNFMKLVPFDPKIHASYIFKSRLVKS